jgi:phosphoribosylanthranilate isomerase
MYKTKILADKISNLTDARYFSARCCDVICFEIPDINDVSKGLILINSIKEWVAGPDIYFSTNGIDENDLISVIKEVNPAGIIVSFFDDYNISKLDEKFLIKEIIPEADGDLNLMKVSPMFNAILIDTRNTDLLLSEVFVNQMQELSNDFKIYIKSEKLQTLEQGVFKMPFISGIGVNGGSELKTGLKSFDEIDELLDRLEG